MNQNNIARKAHVSKMTLSHVINHPDQVSHELMVRVQHAIKKRLLTICEIKSYGY
ncbi:transcriptional regulator, LacI family [Weissella paramesenteroides ATCC 33313]|uniref:Transcriptional regulator, LacI family n=1 Tax=Weissella paramesenteroides ATCC 33313 TaxID=585506 RepID=C5RBY2_WEIPA|nr:transcriptional regulator, LacI family [Weissella paramesenteroides ATCC 33313]